MIRHQPIPPRHSSKAHRAVKRSYAWLRVSSRPRVVSPRHLFTSACPRSTHAQPPQESREHARAACRPLLQCRPFYVREPARLETMPRAREDAGVYRYCTWETFFSAATGIEFAHVLPGGLECGRIGGRPLRGLSWFCFCSLVRVLTFLRGCCGHE